MTRMTSYLRDEIVRNAIAKTSLRDEADALLQQRYALAEEFRIASLGGPDKAAQVQRLAAKIQKDLASLPEGIATSMNPIRHDYEMDHMNLGGLRVSLQYGPGTDDKRICCRGAVFAGDDPLVCRFHELENQSENVEQRMRDLRVQVRAVLNSCTTVKKLLDVWPEAKELLPERLEETVSQLPAVQTAVLNAAIGLPSGAAE